MMAALVEWVWQGMALTAVVAGVLRFSPGLSATTRHLVWWVTLAAVLALPVVPAVQVPATPTPDARLGLSAASDPSNVLVLSAVPPWITATILGTWLGVVVLGLLRLVRGIAHVGDLKRRSRPLPARVRQRLPLWLRACRDGRPTRLRLSDQVDVPCALGLGHAVILLPRRLVAALDPAALDQIVLHEHAHLVRRDDWWRLTQACIEAIAGVHPAVRWVGRRIEVEREAACDDAVVARTGRARHYAKCLAEVAQLSAGARVNRQPVPALVPGAIRSASVLRQRVLRLVDPRRSGRIELAWRGLAAGVAGLAALVVVLAQAPPVVAFRDGSTGGAPLEAVTHGSATRALGLSVMPVAAEPVARLAERAPGVDGTAGLRSPRSSRKASPARPDERVAPATSVSQTPFSGPPTHDEPVAAASSPLLPAVSRFGEVHPDTHSQRTVSPAGGALASRAGDPRPWQALADAGLDIGRVSKKSSLAVAGFFTRAGQTVAGAF